MSTMDRNAITAMLTRSATGEMSDDAILTGVIFDELKRLASKLMAGERRDHTLQPTALVNEAYVRLIDGEGAPPACRDHFFALAARVMRNILVDHARGRSRQKRGGGQKRIPLDRVDGQEQAVSPAEILAVNESLVRLAQIDERKARLVELRFFGGLTEAQAAQVLGISRATASTDWRMARAWLLNDLGHGVSESD